MAERTETGLTITARLDANRYEKGRRVSDQALRRVNLHREQIANRPVILGAIQAPAGDGPVLFISAGAEPRQRAELTAAKEAIEGLHVAAEAVVVSHDHLPARGLRRFGNLWLSDRWHRTTKRIGATEARRRARERRRRRREQREEQREARQDEQRSQQGSPGSGDAGGGTGSVSYQLNGPPNAIYELDFFQSPTCDALGHGEGQTFLGSQPTATDAAANKSVKSLKLALQRSVRLSGASSRPRTRTTAT